LVQCFKSDFILLFYLHALITSAYSHKKSFLFPNWITSSSL